MSIRTWREEFYPTTAEAVVADPTSTRADIIRHSLRKWQGLRQEVLTKHRVTYDGYSVNTSGERFVLAIDSSSCSLCVAYCDYSDTDFPDCDRCPLFKHLGERCDAHAGSPYSIAVRRRDVEPMIKALEEVLENEPA